MSHPCDCLKPSLRETHPFLGRPDADNRRRRGLWSAPGNCLLGRKACPCPARCSPTLARTKWPCRTVTSKDSMFMHVYHIYKGPGFYHPEFVCVCLLSGPLFWMFWRWYVTNKYEDKNIINVTNHFGDRLVCIIWCNPAFSNRKHLWFHHPKK